jgi:hypothetical protein
MILDTRLDLPPARPGLLTRWYTNALFGRHFIKYIIALTKDNGWLLTLIPPVAAAPHAQASIDREPTSSERI